MSRSTWRAAALAVTVALVGGEVRAQTPPQKQTTEGPRAQRPAAGRPGPGGRVGGAAEVNVRMVQSMVDSWALVEARKQLDLSNDQYSGFVTRMTKLQDARWRHLMERNRLLGELRPLVLGAGPRQDEVINEKIKAIDDLSQRSAQEVRQLTLELDATLSPYQRARFRLFEERIELQKLDMLLRVRGRAQGAGK